MSIPTHPEGAHQPVSPEISSDTSVLCKFYAILVQYSQHIVNKPESQKQSLIVNPLVAACLVPKNLADILIAGDDPLPQKRRDVKA